MKTKFAKEKSEYSHLLVKVINTQLVLYQRQAAIVRMRELEQVVKDQGDELIFIVTTRDTNPMKEATAPPMSEKDIQKIV